jgi:ATP-dependent Lhr-like helicase
MTAVAKSRRTLGQACVEVAAPIRGRDRIDQWLASRGWRAWPFQEQAWDAYAAGQSGLIQVATGAGKTYGAYLGPLAELIDEIAECGIPIADSEPRSKSEIRNPKSAIQGLRILFITPLRAVSRDIELALKAPVRDLKLPITIESRTGDTAASIRARQKDRLPNVLITTPESLTLLLTRENAQQLFAGLRCVIVDEWHELLCTKRGTQTELALARLRRFAPSTRTWAMSATISNLEEAANAAVGTLGGSAVPAESCVSPAVSAGPPIIIRGKMDRPVIVDSVLPKDLRRLPWAGHMGLVMLPDVVASLDPAVSTLVFTNTRSQAERWYHAILVTRPEWAPIMALHHGSIDKKERERVEAGLKSGELRIVVATSSLDLGVDFSPVERVFQIGSPKGIARVAQRAGRSSHRPFAPCRITCVPTHALELFEIAAARQALDAGQIEPRLPAPKPLDVLAQHIVTCALGGGFEADDLYHEVTQAWSYRDLTRQEFEWALSLVREGGGTLAAYPDYHRVTHDGSRYRVNKPKIAQLHRLNIGTITADTTLDIRYVRGRSLGRIEEGFIAHLHEGQEFVFAGKTLRFAYLKDLVAYVRPGKGRTSYTPIWSGIKLPISESLAGSIRWALERSSRGDDDSVELKAARPLADVQSRLSHIPAHDEVLAEICRSREGTHLFLFPFEGRLVNAGIASVLALRLTRLRKASFSVLVNDYGMEVMCADAFPFRELLTPDLFTRENLAQDTLESVNITQLAKLQFREIARVAGLVFQTYPGARKSGRQFQAGSSLIFDVLQDFDPGNLLLHQARREVMDRHFEHSRLAKTLDRIATSKIVVTEPERFTPLAFPILIERHAQKLTSETILERVEKMRKQWEWDMQGMQRDPANGSTASEDSELTHLNTMQETKQRVRRRRR